MSRTLSVNYFFVGDIKPANVLLFKDRSGGRLVAKLSDFGSCQPADGLDTHVRYDLLGTEYWNAPEAYDCTHSHYRSTFRDCFSFGLLGFYILFESQPFGQPETLQGQQREDLRKAKMNWRGLSCLIEAKTRATMAMYEKPRGFQTHKLSATGDRSG